MKKILLLLLVLIPLFLVGCKKEEKTVEVVVVDGFETVVLINEKPVKNYYVVVKIDNSEDLNLYEVKVKLKWELMHINHDWNFPKGTILIVPETNLIPHRKVGE